MLLIGFLFYRSRGVVGRPCFRIGNRTIKRGSQVSFSVSVVESSNFCILAHHLYWFLFCSYHGVVLVLVVLVMTRPRSPKTVFICLLLSFRCWRFCRSIYVKDFTLPFISKSPLLCFNIFTCYWVAFVVLFPTKLVSLHSDFV